MAINIFIDSSFLVSLFIDKEITHLQSLKTIKGYSKKIFYINPLVIYESINVICRKWGIKEAIILQKWINKNIELGTLRQIDISSSIWKNAFKQMVDKYSKSGPNIFDYIHFACMTEYDITDVLTFDNHFSHFGFNILN